MKHLILHPTELCQWHALVNEAQASTHLILNENTESYLVFLLMRFVQGTKLVESIIALDFLESIHNPRRHIELLKEVGDKSLLCCGLFPGLAAKKHVSAEYFVDIGQAAYLTVSEMQENPVSNIYSELSEQFIALQKILRAMRGEFFKVSSLENFLLSNFDLRLQ